MVSVRLGAGARLEWHRAFAAVIDYTLLEAVLPNAIDPLDDARAMMFSCDVSDRSTGIRCERYLMFARPSEWRTPCTLSDQPDGETTVLSSNVA